MIGTHCITSYFIQYSTETEKEQELLKNPALFGDPPETRTPDPLIKSQVLYRLS